MPKAKKDKKKKEKKKGGKDGKPAKNAQILNLRDQALFKQLRRFSEIKQYKKAIRIADQILKKCPNHGETLCMKALVLNSMEKKEEAERLVKKGLMFNLKSHLSWHVHGLMYRSNHKYDDAIKCYKRALKNAPKDFKILKDLALLQAQRRMMDGYKDTCRRILLLKSSNRNNWLAYAIGNHLNKDYTKCCSILNTYHGAFDPQENSERGYAHSEMKLYYNMVLEESGDISGALKHLDEIEDEVVDKLSLWEKRAELNAKLGNLKAAEQNYRDLIEYQPETYAYYEGLMQAMGLVPEKKGNGDIIQSRPQRRQRPQKHQQEDLQLTDTQLQELDKLFDEMLELYPEASAPKRLRLNFCKEDTFRDRINDYLVARIRKGVPALFRDVRNFYSDCSKVKIIEDLVLGYLESLRSDLRFTENDEKKSEPPSVFVWALYFIGQHYDYLDQPKKAFEFVEEAIEHTPTNIDLYVLQARIYKHIGNLEKAFELMDFSRKLDTADRYLNTKCVRYALRADEVEQAEKTVALFFREGDGLESLFEMQVMWYELSCGDSYFRQKKYGKALKQFLAIGKHFETINEDQFDFHTYCLRKTTLRAYVRMLRWQDKLKSHKWFFRAARSAIKVYLVLHDLLVLKGAGKKADKKGKKKHKNTVKETPNNKKASKDENDEETLENTTDPLGEATKQIKDLQLYLPEEIETHVLAIDVYLRKNKSLLALKALKKASTIGQDHPDVHFRAMEFWKNIEMHEQTLHPVVKTITQGERKTDTFWNERPLQDVNEEYLKSHPNSLLHCLASAKSRLIIGGTVAKESAFQLISNFSLTKDTTLKECMQVMEWLEIEDGEKKIVSSFTTACSKRFPYATYFLQKSDTNEENETNNKA